MSPLYSSVYDNSWDATTWTLVFGVFVLIVLTLLTAFVALVHYVSQATAEPQPAKRHARRHLPKPHWFGHHHGTPAHI